MARPPPPPKTLDELVWEKISTTGGKTFEIGRSASDGPRPDVSIAARGVAFNLPVHWPVNPDGRCDQSWVNTSPEFANVSRLTRYNLYDYTKEGGSYHWILQFTNEDSFDYYFRDEEGDVYKVSTWRKGDHYVRFDSDKPTIVNVSGD